ncbi:Uncharacterized protein PBTT_10434 [Plasmodiophora brassicae]
MGHFCGLYSTPDAGQTRVLDGGVAPSDSVAACRNTTSCEAIIVAMTGTGALGCNFLSDCQDPSVACVPTPAPSTRGRPDPNAPVDAQESAAIVAEISTGSLSMLWMVTAFALTFGGLLLVR